MKPNKHWVSIALAVAAVAIACTGHDGAGYCVSAAVLIEFFA